MELNQYLEKHDYVPKFPNIRILNRGAGMRSLAIIVCWLKRVLLRSLVCCLGWVLILFLLVRTNLLSRFDYKSIEDILPVAKWLIIKGWIYQYLSDLNLKYLITDKPLSWYLVFFGLTYHVSPHSLWTYTHTVPTLFLFVLFSYNS